MPVIDRALSRASGRDRGRKLASGPSQPNTLTGPGRRRHPCRSAGRRPGRARECTVRATVARYYDPATATFLTRDPLEDVTGEPYEYASDDPIDNSDPSGDFCIGNYCLGFHPGTIPNSIVNLGRGFSFGLSDRIANWISPGASCTVPQNAAQQLVGNGATIIATYGLGAAAEAGPGEDAPYGSTPEGRPYTRHYGTETGPVRNIPGSVVDQTINDNPGVPGRNGTTVYYDPTNDVSVVTGDGGGIVSVHRGAP